MKRKMIICTALIASVYLQACVESDARYVDLNTGEAVLLKKDSATGLMVQETTGKPIEIYVDKTTKDTIYGRTGKVINGKVIKKDNGVYVFTDGENAVAEDGAPKVKRTDNEVKIKNGDYKKEVEKDGDITIKNGDTKIKIDGKTGKRKVKHDD